MPTLDLQQRQALLAQGPGVHVGWPVFGYAGQFGARQRGLNGCEHVVHNLVLHVRKHITARIEAL
jgi:hypothetical protein